MPHSKITIREQQRIVPAIRINIFVPESRVRREAFSDVKMNIAEKLSRLIVSGVSAERWGC